MEYHVTCEEPMAKKTKKKVIRKPSKEEVKAEPAAPYKIEEPSKPSKNIEECKDLVWNEAVKLAQGKSNSVSDMLKIVRGYLS